MMPLDLLGLQHQSGKFFPMFLRWKIARTPGIFCLRSYQSFCSLPLAIVAFDRNGIQQARKG